MYQTAFELLILKCFEKISHKLVHTIHLSHLHLLHFLHGGCDAFSLGFNLIKSPPEVLVPIASFSIIQFAFPFALAFLFKRDFCGAAVSFGSSASSLLDSPDRFKGLLLSAEDMAMKYPLLLVRVSGSRHHGNPERHQFHHRK